MNILLVYPKIEDYTSFWFPHLGLGYLASVLTKQGHKVQIVDFIADNSADKSFIGNLRNIDLVGVTATTSEINAANKICQMVKRTNSAIHTIVGGAHITALPQETLCQFHDIDFGIISEGENSLPAIINVLSSGGDPKGIRGVVLRDNGNIVVNNNPNMVNDLDGIPRPAWEKFKLSLYRGSLKNRRSLELPIITGRGCPFQCVFCQRLSGNMVRYRNIDNIMEEIEYDISIGAKSLFFCDETFTLNRNRVIAICEEIIKRGIHRKIEWNCQTRVDTVDEKVLSLMKKSGCTTVGFGVESGNDEILKASKKGFSVSKVREAFYQAKKIGLRTYMFLIFGLPNETIRSIEDTIKLTLEVNPDYITIGILVPFPGTEVFNMALRGEGGLHIADQNWDNFGKQMGNAIKMKQLPGNLLKTYQRIAYRKFYLRPSRIMNIFGLASLKGLYSWLFKA